MIRAVFVKVLAISAIIAICASVHALSYGNPADMMPRGKLSMSTEYSRQFIYTTIGDNHNSYVSQRLMFRMGYTFLKWMEISGLIGGVDADFDGTILGIPSELNGSWELSPGVSLRLKPPLKFSALGMKFHLLMDGKYIYIRSREEEIPPELTDWKIKGMVKINSFDGAILAVGYHRRFNISFYAGLGGRYVWSEMVYSAVLDKPSEPYQVYQNQELPLGISFTPDEKFFPHMIYPVFGLNWNISGNYVFCFETNLADISELFEMGPKIGFTMGLSHYR